MNGKMLLGILFLVGGIVGIYLVLTGKLPPSSVAGTAAATTPPTNTAGVTGSGTDIPGTTSGGTSPQTATQGEKPAGSGGQSLASWLSSSRPFLGPVASSRDLYLKGGAFQP